MTNPDGRTATLTSGFSYIYISPPQAFVTAVSPNIGSTAGGTPVVVAGTGFIAETIVTFDGIVAKGFLSRGSMYFDTPAHAAGPVDVVVTNPNAEPVTLAAAFTYASADTFDLNGEWEGGTELRLPNTHPIHG